MTRHPFWDRHAPLHIVETTNLGSREAGVPCPPQLHPSTWPGVADALGLTVHEVAAVVGLRAGLAGGRVCAYPDIPLTLSFLDSCGPEGLRRAVARSRDDLATRWFSLALPPMPEPEAAAWRAAKREWYDLVQLGAPESLLHEITRRSVDRFQRQLRTVSTQPRR